MAKTYIKPSEKELAHDRRQWRRFHRDGATKWAKVAVAAR